MNSKSATIGAASLTRLPPLGFKEWGMTGGLVLLVVALWLFPTVWYTRADPHARRLWFRERSEVPGWAFKTVPVSERAENILVADAVVSGEFRRNADGVMVNVFSAKRYSEKPDEIGLFMHTPDRCWTDAGLRLEPVSPDYIELTVQGIRMLFERRIFVGGNTRELVYFGGLVGGQPVPYRLDHNLSVGMKRALRAAAAGKESAVRAADTYFWKRIWQGFVDRNPLVGPKQFIRISTPVPGEDVAQADAVLKNFLGQWLEPTDYAAELQEALKKKASQG